MATPPPPPLKINLRVILSESSRILNAHSRHFLTLSVLFLLPFSLSFPVYPLINQLFPPISPIKLIIFNLLYAIIISILFLLATGSITYSISCGFYDRPVKLVSSIKAAFTFFFPLVPVCPEREFILIYISLLLVVFFSHTVKRLGSFQFKYIIICLVYVIILMFVVAYLQLNWIHAYAVLVYESIWGPKPEPGPLQPSYHNLARRIKVALKMMLFFAFFLGLIDTWSSVIILGDPGGDKWKSWAFVVNIVAASIFYVLFMLYNLAANTVSYMYSKGQHGEHAKEFAREDVSLPSDDGKVPRVVSIV